VTYAELAALTADLPVTPGAAVMPAGAADSKRCVAEFRCI
jgi:hypothetical protein